MELGENEPGEVIETPPVEETTVEAPIETVGEPVVEAPVLEEPKRKGPSDSLIGELTAQRARRREAEARAERAERERDEAKAMVERLASKATEGPPRQEPRVAPPSQSTDEQIRAGVAKARYDEKTQAIYERGNADFGTADFNEAATKFAGTVGDGLVPLVSDIMDVAGDNAHKVIFELSADPSRAIAVRDMPPARRAIAIHKMVEMSEVAKTPLSAPVAKVSKAPAPAPKIQATTVTEKPKGHWWSDKTPDDEFDRNFWENQKARKGMHR